MHRGVERQVGGNVLMRIGFWAARGKPIALKRMLALYMRKKETYFFVAEEGKKVPHEVVLEINLKLKIESIL